VADVRWTVDWSLELDKAKGGYRDVEAGIGSPRTAFAPWGNRERTDWDTETSPPFPYLELGYVENLSGASIPNPKVVVAWYEKPKGSSGKVVSLMTLPLLADYQRALKILKGFVEGSKTHGGGDYAILVKDRDLARRIEKGELQRMFWVTGE
jgi:hypothetical protein